MDDPILEQRLQKAMEPILEDEGLTADLTDAAAIVLIDWAQGEITRLVAGAQELDDEAAWEFLEPRLHLLRHHLRRISKTAGASPDPLAALPGLLVPPPYEEE